MSKHHAHSRSGPGSSARVFVLLAIALCGAPIAARAQQIFGSGSTFANPVMTKWTAAYEKTSGVHIDYKPIGSSAGITEITSDVVDFALTDAPLDDARLLRDGMAQFPVLIGAIVPVVNLEGIGPGQLRFTGQLLADIYLGKVKHWRDAAIAAVNPGLTLPDRPIVVIYRSDGSGTTFNWTDYLSKVSDAWRAKSGVGTSVAWPVGLSGKGNGGVAANVARAKGAIGYVEYTYALNANLTFGLVRDQAGAFVSPTPDSLTAATSGVDWAKEHDFYVLLSDSPAANAWPIMATSFALVRAYPKDRARARETFTFFRWAIENGQDMAGSLHYLPLPVPLVKQIEAYWEEHGG